MNHLITVEYPTVEYPVICELAAFVHHVLQRQSAPEIVFAP